MQDISKETIERAASGDMGSFEAIYTASSGMVYNVAYRVVSHPQDAEEVTQEVFVIIHEKLISFAFQSSLKTWIYRITVNTAINFIKKRGREQNHTVEYDERFHGGSAQEARAEIIAKDQKETIVTKMLNTLNSDQRACVVLRSIEGLSYEDIAETLKININTVRSRLKRAREKLLLLREKAVVQNEM